MNAPAKNIVNLFSEPSRIKEVMNGPWESVSVIHLDGDAVELASQNHEHAGFFLSGVATGTTGSKDRFTLRKGSAFAIPQGGLLVLESQAPASFLHIVLRVD